MAYNPITQCPYICNVDLLWHPDHKSRPVTLDYTGTDGVIKAGTPISAAGAVANNGNAIGILLRDCYDGFHAAGNVVIDGFIRQDVAAEHSGVQLTDDAKRAMSKIVFVDASGVPDPAESGGSSGGGGSSVPKPLTYDYMPEGYPSKSVSFDIEWDGDTSGLVSVADTYYKVANYTTITKADLIGCVVSLQNDDSHPIPFVPEEEDINDSVIPHAIMISDYAIFVSEPTSYGPANFTEPGIYMVKIGEMYTARLVKQTITPIAEEFLPVIVATTVFYETADTWLHHVSRTGRSVTAQEAYDAFMNTRVFIVEDGTTYEAISMVWYDSNSAQDDSANVGYVGLKYVYEGASGVGVHTAKAGDASLIPA